MKKINILTDYTCDLPLEYYKEHDIHVFPLYVTIGNQTYRDHLDIEAKELFEKMDEVDSFPQTAAPAMDFIIDIVKKLPADEDIIYIGLGSGFSSIYQNVVAASREVDNLYPIDSKNLSSGTGLLVLKAVQFREQGLSTSQIIKRINDLVPRVRTQFAIDTFKFLHKGGRCSGIVRIAGTALRIKPIIRVIDGKMEVTKKPIGSYFRALDAQIENIVADKDNLDLDNIFITHALGDEYVDYLVKKLDEVGIKPKHLIESHASSVIATHSGPKCIGLLYIVNK